ncbi:hypothetical protein D9M72_523250 [compost metagenome]
MNRLAASTSALASNFTEVTATWYSFPTVATVPTANGWPTEPATVLGVGSAAGPAPDDDLGADVSTALETFLSDPVTASETLSSIEE